MSDAFPSNPALDAPSSVFAERPRGDFLPPPQEARSFWRMRGRVTRTLLRQAFAQHRFRLALVTSLSLLLWFGLYLLFVDGFELLNTGIRDPVTYSQTVRAVFGMFFAALMVMLVFSSAIILYGALFRSREVAYLLTIPARAERVFLHKFQEAVLLSSWGFLLLGSPMLLAYGVVVEAPWYYFAMLLPFLITFVYIPAAVGAILCLLIMHRLPGARFYLLVAAGAICIAAGIWSGWSLLSNPASNPLTPDWFQEILDRLQFSQQRLLPSWWFSSGLLEAARHAWTESVMFLVVMIANALFCRQLAIWTSGRLFRAAYSQAHSRHTARRRVGTAWIDVALMRLTAPFPLPMRLMMVKDLRLFRRDPVQWSQFLIFFGLLGLYFANVRCLQYSVQHVVWVHMVSFLNLSVVGLLMATFTTRFVFPMISLEGRRFWILGLLPISRNTILWSKFLFAVGGSVLPCSALVLLSDLLLGIPMLAVASHQLTCVILCVGLSGIAVGLGARLPNLRQESPSRIAAGFGGTLNLVISALYIVIIVLLTALPFHFSLVAAQNAAVDAVVAQTAVGGWLQFWLIAGTGGSLLLGIIVTAVPLRIGFRAFRQLEF